jgi:autotransporter passenger strand-loop-strand repeat protein
MSSVTFSSATATFCEQMGGWATSQMIDGVFIPPNGGQGAGWSVFDFTSGVSDAADALLTIASPLPAGQYSLTFNLYQEYSGNPGHILGDFALDYTTAASPTLSSTQIPVSIQSASSLNGTTFSVLSSGELLANTTSNSLGTDTYTITAIVYSANPITGIFLDAIKNPSLPGGGPGGQYPNGNFVVSEFTLDATPVAGVIVSAGQIYNVSAGQTDIGDIVENGGTLNLLSGGVISNTQDSGTVKVSSGGTATGTVVNGVDLNVYGTATGTVVSGSGLEIVHSGGLAIATAVNEGGQVVEYGGTAINPTVNSSWDQAV